MTNQVKSGIIITELRKGRYLKMKEIREKIEKLLCDLLEKSGNIVLNSKEVCLEDRLECYQKIVEVIKKVDEKIGYIISETENY